MASRFAEHLSQRVLVLDGAMGTSLYARDLDIERDYCGCENCTDILARTRRASRVLGPSSHHFRLMTQEDSRNF